MLIKEQIGSQLRLVRERHKIRKMDFSMNRGTIISIEAP
jgi:hypothetical protein